MDREKLDIWCERGIVLLVLAVLLFGPLATGAVRTVDFLVVQALTMLALLLWVARFWVNRKHRIQWTPICWVAVAWVIYVILRYHSAEVEYTARQELIQIVVYTVMFFIVLNNLHRQHSTRLWVDVLLLVATLVSIYAIYQFITGSDKVWGFVRPAQYKGRGSGTYICPNNLAGFLEMLIPIALAHLFIGKCSPTMRVIYGYCSLVMMGGIAVSISRGGWIASCLALLVFFGVLIRYPGYRKPALITLLVILAGAYVFLERARTPRKRLALMFTPGQIDDISIRKSLIKPSCQMWQDNFWFGAGPGHFDHRFGQYRPPMAQTRPVYAHNDYLNTLADYGLIGGLIVLGALGCMVAGVIKTWKYVHRAQNDLATRRSDRAAHVLGVAIGVTAMLFHSFMDFNMHVPANAMLAIVLIASLTSYLRFATDNYWVTPHTRGCVLATLVALAALGYLTPELVKRWQENRWLQKAKESKEGSVQLEALKRAYNIEPNNPETLYSLGEAYRLRSWDGGEDYRDLAKQAMRYYDEGVRLNPFDPYCLVRYGMCLDWLKLYGQAAVYFDYALKLDPNNYYVVALQGWHQMQKRDYKAAKAWFQKSLQLRWYDNRIASSYLEIINRQAAE